MEKDFESWFHYQQHSNRQSSCLNSLSDPFGIIGKQCSTPACMNPPYTNEVPTNGTFPAFVFSGLPETNRADQVTEPRNWFYCLPRFRQAFVPPVNSVPKEKTPFGNTNNCGGITSPYTGTGCMQKKFLVFDQSGDQTTLIYSSGFGTPVPCLTSTNPKLAAPFDLFNEDLEMKRGKTSLFSPFVGTEHNEENQQDEEDSEMHEDTEELNALLYSDEYTDNSDDDEVTSTGHSPSTMTDHGTHQSVEEGEEEVASSFGPNKRRKLLDEGHDMPSSPTIKNSSSKDVIKVSDLEDDAESSCGNFVDDYHVSEESNTLSGKKRSRKERIRETVSILQSIIPGGKGKDAMVVIDEAIHYLKCLKVKAKALGLEDAAAATL